MAETAPVPPPPADRFRWQGLFAGADEPLFLLDRRRRILFVNRAWEALTGLAAAEARGLVCRRQRPAASHEPLEEVLAHALCPPAEVLAGAVGRVRRLMPGREPGRRWWDVEFLPLRREGQLAAVLGRITLIVGVEGAGTPVPLPERLMALRQRVAGRHGLHLLAGDAPAVRRLAAQVRLASQVAAPVLFVGEAGSGKRTLARTVHFLSAAREQSFAVLDCARLPPDAVAAVLLDDRRARHGLGGVYLHGPERLPRDLQLRLSDWLLATAEASGEARPPRLFAGLTAEPAEEVGAGRLLETLAFALATLRLDVPPLRQRLADLPLLVERLLDRAGAEDPGRVSGLTPAAWEVLRAHPWPGNLRELYAVLSAARARAAADRIDLGDLPAALRLGHSLGQLPGRPAERPLPLKQLLEQAERRLIELALRRTRGNRSRAAELLQVWRPHLLRRMEKLGVGGGAETDFEAEAQPEEGP
jgi:transcriptional regulator with PAS, ATPase and Fis domain